MGHRRAPMVLILGTLIFSLTSGSMKAKSREEIVTAGPNLQSAHDAAKMFLRGSPQTHGALRAGLTR